MDYKRLLNVALNIGSEMIISGAEIARVEDTIKRICFAYNTEDIDVFTITSSIVATIKYDGNIHTQTKRVYEQKIDLDKLDKLNSLSRYICKNSPSIEYIEDVYKACLNNGQYCLIMQSLIYFFIAFNLTIFGGGSLQDAVVSGVLGIIMRLLLICFKILGTSTLINMFLAFIIGSLAVIAIKFNLGNNVDKIIVGDIMLMIPGAAFTNSIRDMITGDTMSGMLRFIEAMITAVAIAVGFVIATVYIGGLIL